MGLANSVRDRRRMLAAFRHLHLDLGRPMKKRDGTQQKQNGGRPPFQPTPEQRIEVKALASTGTPHEIIAKYIGISADTLVIHFREELEKALLRMIQGVARNMVHIATVGKGSSAVRAGFQILGRRADWWAPQPLNINLLAGEGLSGLMKACGIDGLAEKPAPDSDEKKLLN